MLNKIITVDLHIHSKASLYKEDPNIVAESDIDHLDTLFSKLQDNHVALFSITDHNTLDAGLYEAIQDKILSGSYADIKGIIPGIEFDVKFKEDGKPCHIMAYFDTKDYRKIEKGVLNPKLDINTKYNPNQFGQILHKIGVPVILIAFQRKSLDANQSGGKNSFSDAVDNVFEMLEVGYISGFDVQKPDVEGMVLNSLHSFSSSTQQKVGMLIASDCHQWSAYPAHDSGRKQCSISFSKIKSLPTFKGLLMALTSPETRFSRIENTSRSVIKSFSYGENEENKIELSPGINVIVGENGSGKSTLLGFLTKSDNSTYEKKIVAKNKLSKDDLVDDEVYVKQSELIDEYRNGDLTSYGIYKNAFPEIDTTDFSQELRLYIQSIQDAVKVHIDAEAQLRSKATDIYFVERKTTFNVTIHTGKLSIADTTKDSERLAALTTILRELDSELDNPYYIQSEKDILNTIKNGIKGLTDSIQTREQNNDNIVDVQNLLVHEIKQYNLQLQQLITSEDQETQRYERSLGQLQLNILQRVKAKNELVSVLPSFPDFKNLVNINSRSNAVGGFIFCSYATFIDEIDLLEENLCERLFTKASRIKHFSDLSALDTEENWVEYVKGATKVNDVKPSLANSLGRFIEEKGNIKHEIKRQGTGNVVRGSTLGEQALIYYEALTDSPSKDSTVFFFDQPEDNISNKKIVERLNPVIGRLRDLHQVIFVTHNPLMVVNLDVDNVVFLESTKIGKERVLQLSASSGCLEDEENNILEKVANQMDGGEEAVEKRLKRYGH